MELKNEEVIVRWRKRSCFHFHLIRYLESLTWAAWILGAVQSLLKCREKIMKASRSQYTSKSDILNARWSTYGPGARWSTYGPGASYGTENLVGIYIWHEGFWLNVFFHSNLMLFLIFLFLLFLRVISIFLFFIFFIFCTLTLSQVSLQTFLLFLMSRAVCLGMHP